MFGKLLAELWSLTLFLHILFNKSRSACGEIIHVWQIFGRVMVLDT